MVVNRDAFPEPHQQGHRLPQRTKDEVQVAHFAQMTQSSERNQYDTGLYEDPISNQFMRNIQLRKGSYSTVMTELTKEESDLDKIEHVVSSAANDYIVGKRGLT